VTLIYARNNAISTQETQTTETKNQSQTFLENPNIRYEMPFISPESNTTYFIQTLDINEGINYSIYPNPKTTE